MKDTTRLSLSRELFEIFYEYYEIFCECRELVTAAEKIVSKSVGAPDDKQKFLNSCGSYIGSCFPAMNARYIASLITTSSVLMSHPKF